MAQGQEGISQENINALGLDLGGAALPGVTGLGFAARIAGKADDLGKLVNKLSKVSDGLKLGESFGKLGTVVENIPGKITAIDKHALLRMNQRNIDYDLMDRVVSNPLVKLEQAGGRTLYLTREAGVVLDKTGKAITTYGKADFQPHVSNILNKIKKLK